ncbi:PT domain-containing protein [Candidatus Dependentiae bacterium]|nr:PT domain-containing protein [Candidatus Dependentiae bacterium]
MDILETLSLGAITGNVEIVKPDAYSHSGTVIDWGKMDSTYGWGEFKSNEMGEVFFKNDNDPFTKADYADAHVAFKLKYMDVSGNNENAIVYLKIYQDSDPSSCLMSYKLELIDYDENTHWLIKTTGHDLSTFDTNNDGIINKASIYHSGNEDDWVRIYELQYIITFEEPVIDLCEGKLCGDKCTGTTWNYNGECDPDTGNCVYTTEVNLEECPGDDPCLGMDCDDTCIGKYWATGGECYNAECIYDTQKKIDGRCGYDVCAGVDCDDTCIGEYRASDGHCEGGECVYDTQEKIDGLCGYVSPTGQPTELPTGEPTPEPTDWPTGEPTPSDGEDSLLDMIVPDTPGEVPEEDILDKLRENIYLVGIIALVVVAGAAYVISTGGLVNKKKK